MTKDPSGAPQLVEPNLAGSGFSGVYFLCIFWVFRKLRKFHKNVFLKPSFAEPKSFNLLEACFQFIQQALTAYETLLVRVEEAAEPGKDKHDNLATSC